MSTRRSLLLSKNQQAAAQSAIDGLDGNIVGCCTEYGHENETSNGGRGGFLRKSLRTKENWRYSEHKAGKTKRARS